MHWLAWRLPLGADQLSASTRATVESLGWWALHFTPNVAVLDEALLLDVASSERLWGGAASLRRLILEHAPRSADPSQSADPRQQWAEGPTVLQALALLRLKQAGCARPAKVPEGLPMFTVTALKPHLETLQNLGCRTLGDVRALPRAGVARRLGHECLLALDQLWGLRSFALQWIQLPQQFDLDLELPYIAASCADLMHAAEHLLTALQGWLRARHLGVLRLTVRWRHDLRRLDGVELAPWGQLELRTAEPLQELSHLRRLLAEQLAHQRLAAPANRVAMRTEEVASLQQRSASLLPKSPDEREGDPWHQFVERVSARLGAEGLRVPCRHVDHRPEHMQIWQSASSQVRSGVQRRVADAVPDPRAALWPAWLLPQPQLLRLDRDRPWLQGQPLSLLVGPERFESGWWEAIDDAAPQGSIGPQAAPGVIKRDYFVAHNRAAGWVWVYRDNASMTWYLHGFYG